MFSLYSIYVCAFLMAFPAKTCFGNQRFHNDFFWLYGNMLPSPRFFKWPSGVGPDARQQPNSSTQCRRGVHLPSIGISASHCTKMLGLSGAGVAVFPPNFSLDI